MLRPIAGALLLAGLTTSLLAADPGVSYRRGSRPRFDSKALRTDGARVVLKNLDLNINALTALVVQGQEVLYELDVSFASPPKDVRVGQQFALALRMTPRPTGTDMPGHPVVRAEVLLDPPDQFLVEGFPLVDDPRHVDIDALAQRVSDGGNGEGEVLTQTVAVTVESGGAAGVVCGYVLHLGWKDVLHEIRIEYVYRSRKGFWRKSAPAAISAEASNPSKGKAEESFVPPAPWQHDEFVRYFAEYIANLNQAVRNQRGVEWSVDAWGREVGPASVISVRPVGVWENPNHYVWMDNGTYDFYPRTVRAYIRERLRGQSVAALLSP